MDEIIVTKFNLIVEEMQDYVSELSIGCLPDLYCDSLCVAEYFIGN